MFLLDRLSTRSFCVCIFFSTCLQLRHFHSTESKPGSKIVLAFLCSAVCHSSFVIFNFLNHTLDGNKFRVFFFFFYQWNCLLNSILFLLLFIDFTIIRFCYFFFMVSEQNGSVKRPSVWNYLLKLAIMRHINGPMLHDMDKWMDYHRIRPIH